MYGSSYGSSSSASSSYSHSYSSFGYSSISSPMDIAPTPFTTRGPDASCAFPSWPRRTSLGEHDAYEERATSYLSDEDLLWSNDVFEDDASSNGSASPIQSPPAQYPTEADLLQMQRERAAYQREMMRVVLQEKERRRQQAKRRSSSTKNKKNKPAAMTPIAE